MRSLLYYVSAPDKLTKRERRAAGQHKNEAIGYRQAFIAMKKTKLPTEKFIQIAKKAFTELHWSSEYGGKAWANIADGWFMLDKANDYNDKVIAIDHAYDLQHNTGSIFNKLSTYHKEASNDSFYKKQGYKWIKAALDHKKNIKNVWELYKNVSSDVKRLTGFVAKEKGYGSLELFLQKAKESNINADEQFPMKVDANGFVELVDGVWDGGQWEDGTFKDGLWKDGIWLDGVFDGGQWEKGFWQGGIWEGGLWKDGIWKKGDWGDGKWIKGTWKNGTWLSGKWYGGTWENGTWEDGDWYDGIFQGGDFNGGTWHDGKWKNGNWNGGTWIKGKIYDPERSGNYEDDWKWEGSYVESKINPTMYFSKIKQINIKRRK
jgi:hypothetical protein